MTTIVANLECMAADRFVSYGPSYTGDPKMWIAKGCVWGAAGSVALCMSFRDWTLGKGKRPESEDGEEDGNRLEVLQLSKDGLFLWVGGRGPDPVREPFYGIGSGGGYAVGALSMNAKLEQAMDVAEKWDANTRKPFDFITLAEAIKALRKR